MARSFLLFFVLLLLPPALLRAAALEPDFSQLAAGESGLAVEVVDGDTLLLQSGTEIRLVGIQAPKLPLGRRGFAASRCWDARRAITADMENAGRRTMACAKSTAWADLRVSADEGGDR